MGKKIVKLYSMIFKLQLDSGLDFIRSDIDTMKLKPHIKEIIRESVKKAEKEIQEKIHEYNINSIDSKFKSDNTKVINYKELIEELNNELGKRG